MSPVEMGAAVADACEWRRDPDPDSEFLYRTKDGRGMYNPACDLNAMHEAEKVLTPAQSERYAEFMLDVYEMPTPFIGTARCAYLTMHATAAQRAEAFLKTLNLWKP